MKLSTQSWWPIFMILIALAIYEPARQQQNDELYELKNQYNQLQELKIEKTKINQNYRRRIKSAQNKEWIEMCMMRVLGVVPENSIKIYFKDSDNTY